MSKRYYLADIIAVNYGDGDEFTTAFAEYPVQSEGGFPVNKATGRPLHNFALMGVTTDNHDQFESDVRIDALPDVVGETLVAQIDAADMARLEIAMQRRGIDTAAIDGADSFGDVLALIDAAVQAPFDENPFPA